MNIGEFLDSWGSEVNHQDVDVIVSNNGVRRPCLGDMVIFVDTCGLKPALVQLVYKCDAHMGNVHLHVFEDKPQDNRAVDAFYSNQHEPGTWHFVGD